MPGPESSERPIQVACACGANFTVPARFAGRTGPCPKCNASIAVPASGNPCPKCGVTNGPSELFCTGCGGILQEIPEGPVPKPVVGKIPKAIADKKTEVVGVKAPAKRPMAQGPATKPATRIPPQAVAPPAAPPPPAEPEAPAEPAAQRRSPLLRSKLAEAAPTGKPLAVRLALFVVLAAGGGVGAYFLSRGTFQGLIQRCDQEEKVARVREWPPRTLDALQKVLVDTTRPESPTPEQTAALKKAIEAEFTELRTQSQEAQKKGDEAHQRGQNARLARGAFIGVVGLLLGLLGWRLTG